MNDNEQKEENNKGSLNKTANISGYRVLVHVDVQMGYSAQ